MICHCSLRPSPHELTGPAAKTATDAAVVRDTFRKYNHSFRNKSNLDNGFWNLSLGQGEDNKKPPLNSPDLINRLPTEILGQILSDVYESTEASADICACSRPNTPYTTTRSRSLVHRVVDTSAIRLTCSRWHSWALETILSGEVGENEHIELDISDLAGFNNKMRFPVGGIGSRLIWDFPYLRRTGITLYLGNPGEVSNLILAVEMLGREKSYGGKDYYIFRGLSFWDLGSIYRDVLPQAPWHAHDLLLLDIISHFSAMPLPTRVQFPATILAAVPHGYWAPVLEGLVRHSDRLWMREFLTTNHAPLTPRRNRRGGVFTLPPPLPKGNYLNLEELFEVRHFAVPTDLDRHCVELHSSISIGPEKHWKRLRYLDLRLKSTSVDGTQSWRIDDTFLAKISCYNPAILVSVQIDGGLASSLTIGGLLRFVQPSGETLKRLVFRPTIGEPDTSDGHKEGEEEDGVKHHCQVLSVASIEKSFPRLQELELHVPCCPDLLHPRHCRAWKSALKRRWKLVIKRSNDQFMGYCQDWTARGAPENQLLPDIPPMSGEWDTHILGLLLALARVARGRLLSRELAEIESMGGGVWTAHGLQPIQECIDQIQAPTVDQDQGTAVGDTSVAYERLGEVQGALKNKWREVAERWQLEIHLENVKIEGMHILGYTPSVANPVTDYIRKESK